LLFTLELIGLHNAVSLHMTCIMSFIMKSTRTPNKLKLFSFQMTEVKLHTKTISNEDHLSKTLLRMLKCLGLLSHMIKLVNSLRVEIKILASQMNIM